MTLNSLHIVVAKDAKGDLKVLHASEDAGAADKAYNAADKDLVIVGMASYPIFTRQRFPTADVELELQQAASAKTAEERAAKVKENKAEELRAQAGELLKKAEALHPKPLEVAEKSTSTEPVKPEVAPAAPEAAKLKKQS